jgi:hypothetical protein
MPLLRGGGWTIRMNTYRDLFRHGPPMTTAGLAYGLRSSPYPPCDISGTAGGSWDTNCQNAGKTSIRNFFSGRI